MNTLTATRDLYATLQCDECRDSVTTVWEGGYTYTIEHTTRNDAPHHHIDRHPHPRPLRPHRDTNPDDTYARQSLARWAPSHTQERIIEHAGHWQPIEFGAMPESPRARARRAGRVLKKWALAVADWVVGSPRSTGG